MNNTHLDQAREWARDNIDDFYEGERVYAVCEVIQSLPDEWIDAEKVQAMIDNYKHARDSNAEGTEGWVINHLMVSNLESLITPPLPTLAEMTPEEREACQWMQADVNVNGETRRVVICHIVDKYSAAETIAPDGRHVSYSQKLVTPLPDLPPMKWPGSTPDDVAYATGGALTTQDVVDECRAVRKERALPYPEDVPEGEVWMIRPYENADPVPAFRVHQSKYGPGKRWAHYSIGGSTLRFEDDEDITLVSRLVPEDKQ